MAKAKFLPPLPPFPCRGSYFPEIESESDQELSFSFLLNNASTDNDAKVQDGGGKMEKRQKEAAVVKGKKRRRHSMSSLGNSSDGVLLNFHVPVPFPESHGTPRLAHEAPCTTLADLQKREMEFEKLGCWSALLLRRRDLTKTDDISQFRY